jgi:hypothetical protein
VREYVTKAKKSDLKVNGVPRNVIVMHTYFGAVIRWIDSEDIGTPVCKGSALLLNISITSGEHKPPSTIC